MVSTAVHSNYPVLLLFNPTDRKPSFPVHQRDFPRKVLPDILCFQPELWLPKCKWLTSVSSRCSFPRKCYRLFVYCCCGLSPWSLQSLCPFSWVSSPSELGLSHDAFWQGRKTIHKKKNGCTKGTKWTKLYFPEKETLTHKQLSNYTVHYKIP